METVDARGLSCPEPVVLTRNALKAHPEGAAILVDAPAAHENVIRYATSQGYQVQEEKTADEEWRLVFTK